MRRHCLKNSVFFVETLYWEGFEKLQKLIYMQFLPAITRI